MLGKLIEKELMDRLLDFRFVAVFAICAGLAALSVYSGTEHLQRERAEYATESARRSSELETWIQKGDFQNLTRRGFLYIREPEPLSPIVYGLAGTLGNEARIRYWAQFMSVPLIHFEATSFEANPGIPMFGVLDLAFIVKIVMSLAALLFTYDTVSGEKENGTFSLYASFPVARSTIAFAKVLGSSLSVLVPLVFACLLSALVLALSPGIGLDKGDWYRLTAIMGVFGLYLLVFVSFGLLASALTHRRSAALLGLLAVWALMVFIIPNAALRLAESVIPVENFYSLDRTSNQLRWEMGRRMHADRNEFWRENFRRFLPDGDTVRVRWDDMDFKTQAGFAYPNRFIEPERKIRSKWREVYHSQLAHLQEDRRNRARKQQGLAMVLSAISPVSAVTMVSMDLARNGLVQQEQVERSLGSYQDAFVRYIWQKDAQFGGAFGYHGTDEKPVLTDFVPFRYQDDDTISTVMARNAFQLLNLMLLVVLGFSGAYVAILRYDVR